jgi:K+-transporting ATPase KdpF subunit
MSGGVIVFRVAVKNGRRASPSQAGQDEKSTSFRSLARGQRCLPLFFKTKRYSMDYLIAGIISLGLAVYLVYALLRPERF